MKCKIALFLVLLFSGAVLPLGHAQNSTNTYGETRKLLLKMERSPGNDELSKLFEEADIRMRDLINALDDPEKQICINAQIIIKYLAEPEGLRILDEWYKVQNQKGKQYWSPKMELLAQPKYLEGNGSDLAKLASRNKGLFAASRFNSGDVRVKVIAYNKRSKAVLLEVIQGEILTAGWHAVIKYENNRWRLISDNNVWVT
jgi:hypothetical protein